MVGGALKSVIVAAHPDDEALWFSSILNETRDITICFLGIKSDPARTSGRERVLSAHPHENLRALAIREAGVFGRADWNSPSETGYGLLLSDRNSPSDITYKQNFYKLKMVLRERLAGFERVFTHGPWGEYGNEEHVQVYRAVSALQKELGYQVWFPGYYSQRSSFLFLKYLPALDNEYILAETDRGMAETLKGLYVENGAWTWFPGWKWPERESFLRLAPEAHPEDKPHDAEGALFPLNFINFGLPLKKKEPAGQALLRLGRACFPHQ